MPTENEPTPLIVLSAVFCDGKEFRLDSFIVPSLEPEEATRISIVQDEKYDSFFYTSLELTQGQKPFEWNNPARGTSFLLGDLMNLEEAIEHVEGQEGRGAFAKWANQSGANFFVKTRKQSLVVMRPGDCAVDVVTGQVYARMLANGEVDMLMPYQRAARSVKTEANVVAVDFRTRKILRPDPL